MNQDTKIYSLSPLAAAKATVGDYAELVKMRLTLVIVLTAVGSFVIVSGWQAGWLSLSLLAVGGFCVTAASNALNQVLEKDFDRLMERTKNRPVTAGRMTTSTAVLFAGFMCILGITLLATFNPLTAFFGMISLVLYAFVYTPLKRYSSAAIFVGAVAGAMPMLIGAVAWSGEITWLALILFGVQFAWQYPHFWSIGFMGHKDYHNAGYKFIPTTHDDQPSKEIAWSSAIYSFILFASPVALYLGGFTSVWACILIALISAYFFSRTVYFIRQFDRISARNLMITSLFYIPVFLLILLIDKFI